MGVWTRLNAAMYLFWVICTFNLFQSTSIDVWSGRFGRVWQIQFSEGLRFLRNQISMEKIFKQYCYKNFMNSKYMSAESTQVLFILIIFHALLMDIKAITSTLSVYIILFLNHNCLAIKLLRDGTCFMLVLFTSWITSHFAFVSWDDLNPQSLYIIQVDK